MSQATDLLAREAEVMRILKVLSSESSDFVVIGGYAINALTAHRFSVDCDIVVNSKGMKETGPILEREGYKAGLRMIRQPIYGVRMKKYVKRVAAGEVSVEVFPKELSCRQTDGTWSFELIRRDATRLRVVGLTESTEAFVPKRELLVAMKMHAGRDTDVRDVAMLSERTDWKVVKEFAACGDTDKVRKQIESAIEKTGRPEFALALKAEFGLRQDVSQLIRRTTEGLLKVLESFAT